MICSDCGAGRHGDCEDRRHDRDYPSCCCQHQPTAAFNASGSAATAAQAGPELAAGSGS